jgi:two-component system sensor histidine kinase VanS
VNPARWPLRRRLVLSLAGMFLLGYTVLSVAGYYFARAWTVPGDSCLVGIYRCEGTYWTWHTRVIVTGLIVTGLAVIAWISWILTGQLLRPLRAAAEAVRRVGPQNLGQRVAMTGAPDELKRLTDALDEALDRIAAGYEGQRRFAANASHELRTPLAITRSLLDVARTDGNGDTGELVDRLHAVNTRAIDLTEALLLLSRADQRSFTPQRVDLSLITEEATETLILLAERRGLTIETSGEMAPTSGSPALLLQMATNLVHNAIVHNLPEHGTVWITSSARPRSVELTVENTGDMLDPGVVSTLAEPFLRGTERVRTDHAGVGLGLAIVKSITQAHDGTLTLTPRSAGGLRATVRLPAAPRHTAG